jgi:adenosylcobinamide-GDP ribazoletransferase
MTLLTRLPITVVPTDGPGAAAFGLVGAVIGAAGAVPLAILAGPFGEAWLGAVGALATIAIVTGGLHLDGLADTVDALSAQDAEAAERARKDPRLGAGGVLAIVLVVAGEVASLASLVGTAGAVTAGLSLVAAAAVSRILPVLAARVHRRGAAEGLGSWFADGVGPESALAAAGSASLVVFGAAWLAGSAGWLVAVAAGGAAILGAAVAVAIVTRRGGLDGDGLGAIVELAMVAGLASAAVAAA